MTKKQNDGELDPQEDENTTATADNGDNNETPNEDPKDENSQEEDNAKDNDEVEEQNGDDDEDESEGQEPDDNAVPAPVKKLRSENKSLRARLKEAEATSKRLSFAASRGIPLELAERLRGETDEELEKDAETLLALLGSQGSGIPVPPKDGANSSGTSKPENETDLSTIGQRMFSR